MSGDQSPPPRFAFVEGALDRADALRDNADALHAYWPNARVLRVDGDGKTRVDAQGRLSTPRGNEVAVEFGDAIFLGMRGDEAWFAQAEAGVDAMSAAPASFESNSAGGDRVDLRTAAATWSPFEATVFAQARAVLHWQQRHRFCGACGGALAFQRGG